MYVTEKEKQCNNCSASYFTKYSGTRYCEACRKKYRKNYSRMHREKQMEKQREKERLKAEFEEIVKKARQEGLSYGEYVARMEGRM